MRKERLSKKTETFRCFYAALQKTVETQLDFHVKEFIVAFLKRRRVVYRRDWERHICFRNCFWTRNVSEVIKQGAGFTGDYLLLYTADVANELKKRYFTKAQQIFDKSAVVLKQKVKEAVDRVEEEIETYTMLQTAKETQLQYSNNLETYEGYLQNIWHDRVATPEGLQIEEILQSKNKLLVRNSHYKSRKL